MKQLNAQDAQFLYIETGNNLTHVMGVNIFDPSTAPGGKVRFKDIIEHIEGRLIYSPVFKRRLLRLPLDFDHPYWVEDEFFDVEHHMFHSRLPEPGDWRQLCIHLARHFSRPMDMNRPLWDMYVIEGLDRIKGIPKGSYAIATRVHHAAIDGASAMHFFSALSDRDPEGTPAIDLEPFTEELGESPSTIDVLNRAVISNIQSPVKMASTLLKFSPAIFDTLRRSFGAEASKGKKVPETRFNQAVSPHKMFEGTRFSLKDLKRIKDSVEGSTINDVVLAICSGALHTYLDHHGELPADPLVAIAPVNARSRGSDAEIPGNNISAMSVALPTNITDPLERLHTIRDTTRQTKAAKTGISARLMTDLSKHVPAATMAGVARIVAGGRFTSKLCNLFVSNVPGPQQPLYMNGAKMLHSYGMAPLADGMGLFIATPSYNGEMTFSIISAREIMPDIEYFRECIDASFKELLGAVT
ncbi:MAG: wax ester/triacylglycerol synthase family O-acyltransferase [Xanthomonadales bacterium]|nr:wax ester/triacylglycerol synthase family O-acyltransferase [Gammaproteobacteria bacterium]MBT8052930.1 wax ester/triacylglycerol synthase family O-acyltransferase [Gammaproteobacteria bacterium]NND57822.1 wax ester/triacylglycerol synthase family O-acyltransferase [Xanthomonadales bacterium]NNK50701.1 wax ester/triacylglycerol synthase family O-acyltransferase [Xanthomonadales bacterium]